MDRNRPLRTAFLYAEVMLIAQFLLGMAVNLFVKIPDQHPGANPPEYFSGVAQSVTWAIFHGHILLALHAGFGLVLVIAAVGTLVQGIRSPKRGIVLSSVFGFVGVLAAGFNGGSFLNYNQDFSSMLMAAGFAIAVVSYASGLYRPPRTVNRRTWNELRVDLDYGAEALMPASSMISAVGRTIAWAALSPVAAR